jgi:phosphoribosylformylglycinamidine synthase
MNLKPAAAAEPVEAPIVLRGSVALSPFRVTKLLESFHAAEIPVRSIAARFVHFVSVARRLSAEELTTLNRLLTYGDPSNQGEITSVIVIPRDGTVSPWSSKATNIAQNCGLDCIKRIERGVSYSIEGFSELSAAHRTAAVSYVFDPMTEVVRPADFDAGELLSRRRLHL